AEHLRVSRISFRILAVSQACRRQADPCLPPSRDTEPCPRSSTTPWHSLRPEGRSQCRCLRAWETIDCGSPLAIGAKRESGRQLRSATNPPGSEEQRTRLHQNGRPGRLRLRRPPFARRL